MKKYHGKKNAGCPAWIIDGVRKIREQATQRPIPSATLKDKNGSTGLTERERKKQ